MNPRVSACAFLRCKQDTYDDPFAEDAVCESAMPRAWWCGKTFRDIGPDGQEVEVLACQAGRTCFCSSVEQWHPRLIEPEA